MFQFYLNCKPRLSWRLVAFIVFLNVVSAISGILTILLVPQALWAGNKVRNNFLKFGFVAKILAKPFILFVSALLCFALWRLA